MKKTILFSALMAIYMLTGCAEKQSVNNNTSSPTFSDVLKSRRSIRNYDASKTISEQEVRTLLTEVQEAPSWANQQPTRYYVAMTQEKVDAVRELIGEGNKKNTAGAPVFIVSTFERGKSGFFRDAPANEIGDGWGAYDNGLSNAYLVLQARAMGFDTLIMGMRDSEALRQLFGISETETIMAVISLGYRADEPNRPGRMDFNDMVKFF